jgi:hypothetical protein
VDVRFPSNGEIAVLQCCGAAVMRLRRKPCKKCLIYEKRLDNPLPYHDIQGEIEHTGGSLNNDFSHSFFLYFSRK